MRERGRRERRREREELTAKLLLPHFPDVRRVLPLWSATIVDAASGIVETVIYLQADVAGHPLDAH